MWIVLLITAHQWLALKDGRAIVCDRFEHRDAVIVVWDGPKIYSLPDEAIDWRATRNLAENPPPPQPKPTAAPAPEPNRLQAFLGSPEGVARHPDLVIDKLDVKDANLVDLLRFISDRAGFNLVVDASVKDVKVTVSFRHIRWDQALDIILQSQGLACEPMSQSLRIRCLPATRR